jgi:uncharacterized protein (TIGR02271 family)
MVHPDERDIQPADAAVEPQVQCRDDESEVVIPVIAEALTVEKRPVATGGVRVRKQVVEHTTTIDMPLWTEELQLEHVPVGRFVDSVPETRCEGNVTIVPVMEERIVVHKRLWLREELHIRRHRTQTRTPQTFTVQREELSVEPLTPEQADAEPGPGSNATPFREE